MQNKILSAVEATISQIVGTVIAVVLAVLIGPYFNLHIRWLDCAVWELFLTTILTLKSYIVRRVFERYL